MSRLTVRWMLLPLWFPLLLVVASPVRAEPEPRGAAHSVRQLQQQLDEFTERYLELHPLVATLVGDARYADRLPIPTAEYRAQVVAFYDQHLARLAALPVPVSNTDARLTYDVFALDLRRERAALDIPDHLLPLSHWLDSLPNYLPQLAAGDAAQPLSTAADHERFLRRLHAFPVWVDAALANLRQGLEQGIVQSCDISRRALPQLATQLVDDPRDSPFFRVVTHLPSGLGPDDRGRLSAAYEQVIREQLVPAYRRLHDFVRDVYLPRCRESLSWGDLPGGGSLPDGDTWYRRLVAHHTTTDLTPDEIFDLGVREAARIRRNMQLLLRRLGFQDFRSFFADMGRRRGLYLQHPEEVLAEYQRLDTQIRTRLPELFPALPGTPLEVRPVSAELAAAAPGGYYTRPTADGARPGIFWVNTGIGGGFYPRFIMESLFLHEGLPGHHYQAALMQEDTGLPAYRRFTQTTAFVEGWALYAETLGEDLGLYRDPYQQWGALASDMLRAARLVGDVGLHHKRWTREQTERYLTRCCLGLGISEIDRWAVIPAQGLAYKVGQLRFLELRERAEEVLDDRFDVREFHRQVLAHGALPLDLLEQQVDAWLASRGTSDESEGEWVSCDLFPPEDEPIADCARRTPQGVLEVRSEIAEDASVLILEGRLHFVAATGKTAAAYVFDNGPDYFVEGLARFVRDDKIGFVNEQLERVVPAEWDFAFPFEGGVARVCRGCRLEPVSPGDEHRSPVGGKWGYVDPQGRVVVAVEYELDELPAPSGSL